MRTKSKRLIKQSNISFGRCIAVSVLASVVSNALVFVHAGLSVVNIVLAVFVHAGLSVVNIVLAIALCSICFKYARLKRFRRLALTAYLFLIVISNLPSVLMSALLVFSFALCFVGRLDWNELAATL